MKALLAIDGSTKSAFGVEIGGQPRLALRSRAAGPDSPPVGDRADRRPLACGRRVRPLGRHARRPEGATARRCSSRRPLPSVELGLEVTTRLIEGRAASVIVDTARDIGADLVVLGARGHGAIEAAFLGSVSAEVVDQAPCAVLVARGPSAERVLIGTDGSDVAMSAAQFVGGCGLFRNGHVRVVHAIDVNPTWWLGLYAG